MKIKTKSGITEEIDFDRIANELQQRALDNSYYFTKGDLDCLIKDIKDEMDSFLKKGGIISVYDLKYVIRIVLLRSKFRWICREIYV